MFITDQDYKVVIGDNALKVVSQTSEQNRANAEAEAQEEIQANANQTPLLVDNDTGEVIDNADGLLAQDAPSDDLP